MKDFTCLHLQNGVILLLNDVMSYMYRQIASKIVCREMISILIGAMCLCVCLYVCFSSMNIEHNISAFRGVGKPKQVKKGHMIGDVLTRVTNDGLMTRVMNVGHMMGVKEKGHITEVMKYNYVMRLMKKGHETRVKNIGHITRNHKNKNQMNKAPLVSALQLLAVLRYVYVCSTCIWAYLSSLHMCQR